MSGEAFDSCRGPCAKGPVRDRRLAQPPLQRHGARDSITGVWSSICVHRFPSADCSTKTVSQKNRPTGLRVSRRTVRPEPIHPGPCQNFSSMKRIRINHTTEYNYNQPVTFGPHRALMRPREGHDVHIESGRLDIEPKATVRWLRDLDANSVAIITFSEPAATLRVCSEVHVDLFDDKLTDCQIDPSARAFPFHYSANEQLGLVPYRLPSYPHDGTALQRWLRDLYHPGQLIDTFDLLNHLNTHIFESLKYTRRRRSRRPTALRDDLFGQRILPRLCRPHDGGRPPLGVRGAIRHRLCADGRGSARRHARVDGNLHSWSGLAGIRSHEQQARRRRAYLCRRGSLRRRRLAALWFLGWTGGRL